MIKLKKKICVSCERERYIFSKKRCKECAAKEGKKARVENRQVRKEQSELELFEEIYRERGARSEISGKPLLPKGHPMWHWQFSHTLPDGTYKKMKYDKRNIVLMTWDEHQLWEFNAHKIKDKAEWQWVFMMRDSLKAEYYGTI